MKTINLTVAALAVALAGFNLAVAQDKSREEVRKEAREAVRAGTPAADVECPPVTEQSTRSREAVRAEGKAAVKAGEGKGEWECPRPTSPASREAVRGEAKDAVKAGKVDKGEAGTNK